MMHLLPKMLRKEHMLLSAMRVHQDQCLAAVPRASMVSLHHQTGGNEPCQRKTGLASPSRPLNLLFIKRRIDLKKITKFAFRQVGRWWYERMGSAVVWVGRDVQSSSRPTPLK